jgi:hypothetical protein
MKKFIAIMEGPEGSIVKWFAKGQEAMDFLAEFKRDNKNLPQMRWTLAECTFTIEG